MRYEVYADIMLIYDFAINIAVLIISSMLMHIRIKIKRLLLWALITGILTDAVYVLLIGNILLPLFYALIYLFMTITYFKTTSFYESLQKTSAVLISMPLIYGMVNTFKGGGLTSLTHILISLTIGILLFSLAVRLIKHKLSGKYQNIILKLYGKKYRAVGYLDTGNSLTDPFTKKAVVIADINLINKITDNSVKPLLEEYSLTGYMDYVGFKNITGITLHPVPYSTISSSCELIPVCNIDYMVLPEERKKYTEIALGISRYKLKNDFQILLNENLITN
ncbi:MAG: sigma-E processing peptidase SpoIIGA [Lachnospiraceae bacterium]|nr:sigma-E processing peptidase SpoIIGA [Lachnospiraceae bacterium]